jgi:hypothetical protein
VIPVSHPAIIMKIHLYLSLNPEALIASHLAPEEFGAYLAVGTQKYSRGQAMFFEVDPDIHSAYPPFQGIAARCQPHLDGSPRRSTYLAIYRVLEHVPVAALGQLHLVTHDGRVLALNSAPVTSTVDRCFHLYQEFCPVTPRVVSTLDPAEFCARLTDATQPVNVPRIAFAELTLGRLATDIDSSDVGNLPYSGLQHLRECLRELNRKPGKPTKVTVRNVRDDVLYRTIQGGFYVGQGHEVKFYPMPAPTELDSAHHEWWHSAQASFGS